MVHNKDYGHYDETNGQGVMSDIIQTWIEQLLIPELKVGDDAAVKARRTKFPVPKGLKWVFCQGNKTYPFLLIPEQNLVYLWRCAVKIFLFPIHLSNAWQMQAVITSPNPNPTIYPFPLTLTLT